MNRLPSSYPWAAKQDFFFVFGLLCRSAEFIQILVELPVDTGILAHLHDRTVCLSHFLHKLVDAAFPATAGHGSEA